MLSNLFQKLRRRLHRFAGLPVLFRFNAHNRSIFSHRAKSHSDAPIMLMELNAMHSAHIAYSYLADEMVKSKGAQVKAYAPYPLEGLKQKISFKFKALIGWGHFGAYKSFGVSEFIEVKLTDAQCLRAKMLYEQVLPSLKDTRDLEDLHIEGIWIGDLVYDTFLMTMRKPTIDLASEDFKGFLMQSIQIFTFWNDYMSDHNVCGINVSHCVYNLAIPLRIAVGRGIPAFQVNATHVYRLGQKNLFAYNDFFQFREHFAELPAAVREAGLALAESRIQRRFAGEVGVDMPYSTMTAYGNAKNKRLLRASGKKKILIATHCFFDSPHSYGKNIFPDFYEWIDFLGGMTELTDYDWYIKTHPDFLAGTKEIIDSFIVRYPRFTLLPADASHHQIISEGIDVALTSYGTIAFEYAALGVPVINASMNNPHIAYDFNLHAPDVETYRRWLLDLDQLKIVIDRRQVYEYYFMRHIYNTENIFFENYERAIQEIGGYDAQFSFLAYRKWLEEWTPDRHQKISNALHSFIASEKFRMDYGAFGEDFTLSHLWGKE